jgi:hypothetical protein
MPDANTNIAETSKEKVKQSKKEVKPSKKKLKADKKEADMNDLKKELVLVSTFAFNSYV